MSILNAGCEYSYANFEIITRIAVTKANEMKSAQTSK